MNSNPSYLNDIIPIKFPKSWGKMFKFTNCSTTI